MEGMRAKLLEKRNNLESANVKKQRMIEAWNEDNAPPKKSHFSLEQVTCSVSKGSVGLLEHKVDVSILE